MPGHFDSTSERRLRPRRVAACCLRPSLRGATVAGGDEDAVTLAAEAALPLLAGVDGRPAF